MEPAECFLVQLQIGHALEVDNAALRALLEGGREQVQRVPEHRLARPLHGSPNPVVVLHVQLPRLLVPGEQRARGWQVQPARGVHVPCEARQRVAAEVALWLQARLWVQLARLQLARVRPAQQLETCIGLLVDQPVKDWHGLAVLEFDTHCWQRVQQRPHVLCLVCEVPELDLRYDHMARVLRWISRRECYQLRVFRTPVEPVRAEEPADKAVQQFYDGLVPSSILWTAINVEIQASWAGLIEHLVKIMQLPALIVVLYPLPELIVALEGRIFPDLAYTPIRTCCTTGYELIGTPNQNWPMGCLEQRILGGIPNKPVLLHLESGLGGTPVSMLAACTSCQHLVRNPSLVWRPLQGPGAPCPPKGRSW
mmetsp:Transcript_71089/g.201488  ORF Transcript_71089/g.201488 Transcript_71089/m.201488 type:complete len:367 (-) Transcript_71089:60-1160(-)